MQASCARNAKHSEKECQLRLGAIEDALYVIGGKWKLKIIVAMRLKGTMRFNELQRTVEGISAKVLSNELKELEMNGFVKRNVYAEMPVIIEYQATDYSDTLGKVLQTLVEWGTTHRAKIRRELSTR